MTDFVEMAFSVGGRAAEVTLSSLTFGWIGEWTVQGFDLGVDGSNGAFEVILDSLDGAGEVGIGVGDELAAMGVAIPNLEQRRSRGTVDLSAQDLIDSIFGVKAGALGSWKLLSVAVTYDEPSVEGGPLVIPEVPLPTGIWLLLSGVGGLLWLRPRGHA